MSAGFGESPFGSWPFGGGYPDSTITATRTRVYPLMAERVHRVPVYALHEREPMPLQAIAQRVESDIAIAHTIQPPPLAVLHESQPSPLATSHTKQLPPIAVAREGK